VGWVSADHAAHTTLSVSNRCGYTAASSPSAAAEQAAEIAPLEVESSALGYVDKLGRSAL